MGWFDEGIQYYGLATSAIFFYEYLAMLPDEVRAKDFVGPFATVDTDALPRGFFTRGK